MSFPVQVESPTGSVITLKIREDASGDFLDFADGTFKAAGHTTPSVVMTEPDAVEFPGLFRSDVDPALWSDGSYTASITDAAASPQRVFDPIELIVSDGTLHRGDMMTACAIVRLESSSGVVGVLAWVERDGRVHGSPDSLALSVFDKSGGLAVFSLADATPDARGVFAVETPGSAGLTGDTEYYATVTITIDGIATKSIAAFVVY